MVLWTRRESHSGEYWVFDESEDKAVGYGQSDGTSDGCGWGDQAWNDFEPFLTDAGDLCNETQTTALCEGVTPDCACEGCPQTLEEFDVCSDNEWSTVYAAQGCGLSVRWQSAGAGGGSYYVYGDQGDLIGWGERSDTYPFFCDGGDRPWRDFRAFATDATTLCEDATSELLCEPSEI